MLTKWNLNKLKKAIPSHQSEWLVSKRLISSVGEDVEENVPLYSVGGTVNWCGHYGKQYGVPSKT